jgi:hypothetical protein
MWRIGQNMKPFENEDMIAWNSTWEPNELNRTHHFEGAIDSTAYMLPHYWIDR